MKLLAEVEKFGSLENLLCADELHFISEKGLEWTVNGQIAMAGNGELICANDKGLLLESADGQGWIKLFKASEETKVRSPTLHDGILYFVVTDEEQLQHTVRCMRIDPSEVASGELVPLSQVLFKVDFEKDEDIPGSVPWTSLSVSGSICLLACGNMIATYNLEQRALQRRTIRLDRGIIDAVLVSPDRCFFTTPGDRDVVMLSGDLMTCAPKTVTSPYSYGLCRRPARPLLLLPEQAAAAARSRVALVLLAFAGQSASRLCLTSLFAPLLGNMFS